MGHTLAERVVEARAQLRDLVNHDHRDRVYVRSTIDIYEFDAFSSQPDDGDLVFRPNNVNPNNVGRFKKVKWGTDDVPPGGGGGSAFAEDEFTVASNGQTSFVLSQTFLSGGLSILFVNSTGYAEGTDYTVSGTTLTWLDTDFTLEIGDKVVLKYEV